MEERPGLLAERIRSIEDEAASIDEDQFGGDPVGFAIRPSFQPKLLPLDRDTPLQRPGWPFGRFAVDRGAIRWGTR